jgi:hypothetical protein
MPAFVFAFLFPLLSIHRAIIFTPVLYWVFVLSRLFFFFINQVASSREWVKLEPAAEGGGLSRSCFVFFLLTVEIKRVTRYEGWTDLGPDERSIDGGRQIADHILDTIVVRRT